MFFFQWKKAFFFKTFCFQQPSKFFKKCCYKFHSKSQNSLWNLIKCSPMFVTLDVTRKNGPIFCHRENATFWNGCFNRPLRFQRNGLVICTIICHNILWTVIKCSLAFARLDNTRKTRPKFFFGGNFAFFQNFLFSTISMVLKKLI